MLDRHGGAALLDSVERFDLVQPVALDQLLRLKRVGVALRVAPRPWFDSTGMTAILGAETEHNKNAG